MIAYVVSISQRLDLKFNKVITKAFILKINS